MNNKSYKSTVKDIMALMKPRVILDAPCGDGWLKKLVTHDCDIHGIDLFCTNPDGYKSFSQLDLDLGLPNNESTYDAIVCCEGIEHFGNPDLFIKTAYNSLKLNGVLIITTPNIWYPASKIKFLLRGFFPSFPCLVGKIQRGSHMHIMPWSYPHIYLYLRKNGFADIKLYELSDKKPKNFYEKIFGIPQLIYCAGKLKKSKSEEEREFWRNAGSTQSVYGRRLVVSALKV